ncbi:MAG: hypothetical protein C0625_07725 [Arcobacter sp.]|nr:MAG: hypothetical protein C0625_07725 [Arcobacter sp.]
MYYKFFSVVLFSLLIVTGCEKKEDKIVTKPKVKIVKILNISDSEIFSESYTYPAQVEAFQDATMAFEVSGKIVKFNFDEGEKVKKGSVIAELDGSIYKANYNQVNANYKQAKSDYKRYEKLYKSKSVAKIDLEKQKQNLDVTRALFQVAKKNLEETKLIAEFDGVMAKKMVNDFERVTVKQPIIRLQDNSSFKIKFFVPENDILKLKGELTPSHISKIVDFYVTFGNDKNKKYDASLLDISTTAEEITRTFEATLQMKSQKDVTILPGMTAQVKAVVKVHREKNIFIPYKALFTDEKKSSYIWIIDEKNKVHKKQIKIGDVSGDSVEVLSGLDKTSKVVTSGIRFLEENDEVTEYRKIGN